MADLNRHSPAYSRVDTPPKAKNAEYILLRSEQLMLIMPQRYITGVRHLGDDEIEQIHTNRQVLQPHSIRDGKTAWYAALSDQLTLLASIPKDRFLLTTFADYPDIHWCWRELYQINSSDYTRLELPAIICNAATPVHALAVLDPQRRAFFTTPQNLIRFVQEETA